MSKSYMARKESTTPDWFVLDGEAQVVGRLATRIATVLMGKHKPTYTPHVDCGDYVIVVNCERVRFSGQKLANADYPYLTTKMLAKEYDRYSGYPGGRTVESAFDVWQRRPELILQEAVRRMLPKNKLGVQMLKKLKLCVGPEHPHQAQNPAAFPQHLMP